jgi:hypothetical protein
MFNIRLLRIVAIISLLPLFQGCELLLVAPATYGEVASRACDDCMGDLGKYKVSSSSYPIYHTKTKVSTPQKVNRKWTNETNSWRTRDNLFMSGYHNIERTLILPTDKWKVTYKVGETLIIESDDYNERICRRFDKAYPNNGNSGADGWVNILGVCFLGEHQKLGIFIDKEGRIAGGWVGLSFQWSGIYSYSRTILRVVRLEPDAQGNIGWPDGIVFEVDK